MELGEKADGCAACERVLCGSAKRVDIDGYVLIPFFCPRRAPRVAGPSQATRPIGEPFSRRDAEALRSEAAADGESTGEPIPGPQFRVRPLRR